MLVRFENVTIEAGKIGEEFHIVNDISFTLGKGEVLGLIGESGAGKSTLGLAALGYLKAGCRLARGRVLFNEIDMFASAQQVVRAMRGTRIAYVAQSAAASFTPTSTLASQIIDAPVRNGLMTKHDATLAMVAVFKTLQLPDPEYFGEKYPHQVSGGQLQRAMLAMAMIAKPDVLVLDEPTTALDVSTQLEFLLCVRQLIREHNVAGLYITHDLATVAQLADRILVLNKGRMVETGDTDTILFAPAKSYTRELITAQSRNYELVDSDEDHSKPILEVRDITAAYGTKTVLNGINLYLGAGQALAIVGESGSGKSTLARVIMGLLKPKSGQLLYRGQVLDKNAKRTWNHRKKIQLINQSPDWALNPRETVEQTIRRPLEVFAKMSLGPSAERVDELLKMVGLSPALRSRFPGQLSGGEKQRVCIARALAADPEIIICDEVTASLDTIVADGILTVLKELKSHISTSLIVITHDFHVVRALAENVVVLRSGEIQEVGTASGIISNARSPYVKSLLSAVPEMRRDWLDSVDAVRKTS